MHRISYILYNYDNFRPQDFYVIGSNRILLNYITSVLPDLDVYGISQMTMEQLFTRLLYEDWDKAVQKIGVLDKKNLEACIKGSYAWFHDLEKFCEEYERNVIPMEDVVIPKTGVVLVTKERIEAYISERPMYSMQSKINGLTEMLQAKLDNELIGKSVTYSKEEKKELYHESKYHFGKDEWKGSVYDLYQDFLKSQREKGHNIFVTDETYDVYDLAALAFLYKRIKEIDGIREASHIIIDEAQDFGMMAYGCLTYCLRGCTYTIMGDVSQNIHYGYGLNDWEDLKKLILTGSEDSFGLLKKSYRNTVEISNFATEILRHGNFAIYPVEPIIRHGNEVIVSSYENEEKLIEEVANQIQIWQKDGHETIAVICKDEKESRTVSAKLGEIIKLADSNLETAIFEQGVMVLPVEYTKGLEFDAVILYDPSRDKYPEEDQYVKLLYVAATRALHELAVLHLGDLSDLIGKPVSAEKRMSLLKENSEPKKKVQFKKEEYVYSEEKKEDDLERYLQRTRKRYLQPKAEEETQQVAQEELTRKGEQKSKVLKKSETYGETDAATSPHTSTVLKQNNLKQTTSSSEQRISSQESKLSPKRIRESITGDNINPSSYPFNSIVDNTKLTPKGHSRIDCSIRWAKNMKKYFDFASNYGVLRIIPVEDNVIRVQFTRGQEADYDKGYWEYEPTNTVPFSARKSPTQYEVSTGALVIRIDKNTGVLHFFDKKGNLLLEEQAKLPRQIEVGTDGLQSWNYFDWKKNEKLKKMIRKKRRRQRSQRICRNRRCFPCQKRDRNSLQRAVQLSLILYSWIRPILPI